MGARAAQTGQAWAWSAEDRAGGRSDESSGGGLARTKGQRTRKMGGGVGVGLEWVGERDLGGGAGVGKGGREIMLVTAF